MLKPRGFVNIENQLFIYFHLNKNKIVKNKPSFWAKIVPLVVLIAATLNTALSCDDGEVVLSPARLEIAPAELDFGENDNSLAFAIKNTGQQNLTWTVSESLD